MYGIETLKPPERTLYNYEGHYWIRIVKSNSQYAIQKDKLSEDKKDAAKVLFQRVKRKVDRVYESEPVYIWDVDIPNCGKGRVIM